MISLSFATGAESMASVCVDKKDRRFGEKAAIKAPGVFCWKLKTCWRAVLEQIISRRLAVLLVNVLEAVVKSKDPIIVMVDGGTLMKKLDNRLPDYIPCVCLVLLVALYCRQIPEASRILLQCGCQQLALRSLLFVSPRSDVSAFSLVSLTNCFKFQTYYRP